MKWNKLYTFLHTRVCNRNLKQSVKVHFDNTSKVYFYTLFSLEKCNKVYEENVFHNLKNKQIPDPWIWYRARSDPTIRRNPALGISSDFVTQIPIKAYKILQDFVKFRWVPMGSMLNPIGFVVGFMDLGWWS